MFSVVENECNSKSTRSQCNKCNILLPSPTNQLLSPRIMPNPTMLLLYRVTILPGIYLGIYRLNSEDFSKIFSVLRYFIFDLFTWKQTSRNVKKCWIFSKFFRIFLNIHDFFELFKVFRIKLLSTARHKHVICIIRCAIKFHVGLFLSGRWARLGKNGFIGKTVQKWDFTRVEIA